MRLVNQIELKFALSHKPPPVFPPATSALFLVSKIDMIHSYR
jgi:hypothetical protein